MPADATLGLARHPGKLVDTTRPTEVLPGIFATGAVPRSTGFEDTGGPFYLDEACTRPDPLLDDQALYFATTEGMVIVLGCAHAGVINTISHIAAISGTDQTHAVVGGMHLVNASQERIDTTAAAFNAFDVQRLGPAHCTGARALAHFQSEFPDRLLPCSTGWSCSFRR